MTLRILGIDPGSHVTGYGVIEKKGNYLKHVVHGEIKPKRNSSLSEILVYIYQQLSSLIAQTVPQAVALENIFYDTHHFNFFIICFLIIVYVPQFVWR